MTKLLVLYGKPTNPEEFHKYYRKVHIPLAKKISYQKYTISKEITTLAGGPAPFFVAALDFDSLEALQAAMGSPEGQAAAGDVPNFATGGVTIVAYDEEKIPRKGKK